MQVTSPPPWQLLALDITRDGQFTVSDIIPLLTTVFFLPGDCLIWLGLAYAPQVVHFFELSPSSFGGFESAMVSAAAWLLALLLVGATYSMLVRLKWAIQAALSGVIWELKRRVNMLKILLRCHMGRIGTRTEPMFDEMSREIDLDEQALTILTLHGHPDANVDLGIREIAKRAGLSRREAQRTIERLKKLQLLTNRMDDTSSYELTRPGEMFLTSHKLLLT